MQTLFLFCQHSNKASRKKKRMRFGSLESDKRTAAAARDCLLWCLCFLVPTTATRTVAITLMVPTGCVTDNCAEFLRHQRCHSFAREDVQGHRLGYVERWKRKRGYCFSRSFLLQVPSVIVTFHCIPFAAAACFL